MNANARKVFYTTNVIVLFDNNEKQVIELAPRVSMEGVQTFVSANAEKPAGVSESVIYHTIKRDGEINIDCNDDIFSKYASRYSNVVDVALQIGSAL